MREDDETLEAEELAPLLLRLTEEEFPVIPGPTTRISEVAEATGLEEAKIRSMLREIRRNRLSERLRILEEPLYRVERPGFHPTSPIADYLARERTLNTLLDDHPPVKNPPEPVPAHAPIDRWITLAILLPTCLAFVYFLIRAVLGG